MYLSESVLRSSFKKIADIGSGTGKAGLERVSAVSRFFACANLIHKGQTAEVNLAPEAHDRANFVSAVGEVISVGDEWQYTPDFIHRESKKDYAVGNNFLTTQVSGSKGRSEAYPKRPAPLLELNDQMASLHVDHPGNLLSHYNWGTISAAFGVWLCRFDDLGQIEDTALIAAEINSLNNKRFGSSVAKLIEVKASDIASLSAAGEAPTQASVVDTSNFGIIRDDKEVDNKLNRPIQSGVGVNHLLYGAPGTGKSHKIDALVGTLNVVRTVFHPDTQNSDFFGSLKPRMNGDKITYSFAAGPFSKALKGALINPMEHHFLVIEELNRAPAAAVFGELFQLLDRVPDTGESSYSIAFPSPESEEWFNDQEEKHFDNLFIPGNLTIFATMNSADQGVYPLDTAFRRRWSQEYLPLYSQEPPSGDIEYYNAGNSLEVMTWDKFVRTLNNFLVEEYDASEDRLLGHWFVRQHELSAGVPEKILLYLWDDLLRHEDRFLLFNKSAGRTYGQLYQAYKNNTAIFSDRFLSILADVVRNAGD